MYALMLQHQHSFLNKGGILNHSKLVLEVYKLHPRLRLCENVSNLLVHRNVLEPHYSLLYHS